MNNVTQFYSQPKILATKMDKTFDFTSFLDKEMIVSSTPEVTELNRINDETYNKGLLKTIIMAANGSFEIVDSKYGFSVKNQTSGYTALGEAYDSLSNGLFVTTNPAEKLPRRALETVVEWYRRITEKNGQEAQVNFYYNTHDLTEVTNEDGETVKLTDIPGLHFWTEKLFSYTPLQNNSSGLTSVDDDDPYYDVFNRTFGMYVETHSHNSMDAFASSTDEENSQNDGFQLVFGRLNTANPVMYSWATMNYVMKLGLSEKDLDFIMEFQPESSYDKTNEKIIYSRDHLEFDESLFEEWDKQVVVRRYHYQATNYTNTGQYNTPAGYSYTQPRTVRQLDEMNSIKELLNDTFLDNQTMFGQYLPEQFILSNDELMELLKEVYLMGYTTKRQYPYYNTWNATKIETSVIDDVNYIYDEYLGLNQIAQTESSTKSFTDYEADPYYGYYSDL